MYKHDSGEAVRAFGFFGLSFSIVLLATHIAGAPVICAKTTPAIMAASYFMGLPVALWGVIMFGMLLGFAKWSARESAFLATVMTGLGCWFVVHLVKVSIKLHAFCPFCGIVWVLTGLSFIACVVWLFRPKQEEVQESTTQ